MERVTQQLRVTSEELNHTQVNYRNIQQELESWKRKTANIESSMSQEWQVQRSNYEQKINGYMRENEELKRKCYDD